MPIRFDHGELRSPFRTDDGMVIYDAVFARDGVLEYRQPSGKVRRELRLPEENKRALTGFGIAPVTIEHPPGLVTEDNSELYRKGVTLQDVQYGKGGFVRGSVVLMDSSAIAYADNGGAELSAGYTCDLEESPGVWQGIHYDAIQRNVQVNHVALTKKGRAGPEVRLNLDSDLDFAYQVSSSLPTKQRMATIRIDSVEYELPETVAPLIGAKLSRLDSVEQENSDLKSEKQELEQQLEEVTAERDRETGRADSQDICLTNAEVILDSLGYKKDSFGDYIRVDGGKKHMKMMDEDEEMEEEVEEEDGESKIPAFLKKKVKKDKKYCDSDVRTDAKELAIAFTQADALLGAGWSAQHLDSVESVADLQRLAIAELRPDYKERADSMSDAAVNGFYDALNAERGDARTSFKGEVSAVAAAAQRSALPATQFEDSREGAAPWEQPLSLSRN